jgi:hypothetical protein
MGQAEVAWIKTTDAVVTTASESARPCSNRGNGSGVALRPARVKT